MTNDHFYIKKFNVPGMFQNLPLSNEEKYLFAVDENDNLCKVDALTVGRNYAMASTNNNVHVQKKNLELIVFKEYFCNGDFFKLVEYEAELECYKGFSLKGGEKYFVQANIAVKNNQGITYTTANKIRKYTFQIGCNNPISDFKSERTIGGGVALYTNSTYGSSVMTNTPACMFIECYKDCICYVVPKIASRFYTVLGCSSLTVEVI
jgi:hypothetical protein